MTIDTRIFITASCVGSYNDAVPKIVYGGTYRDVSVYGYSGFIPDSFDWLNYHIYEPISGSENTLGWPLFDPLVPNDGGSWNFLIPWAYNTKFVKGFVAGPSKYTYFNTLMNKRNGSYQGAGWKLNRNADHPLVKYQRKNCFMPFLDPPSKQSVVSDGVLRVFQAMKGTKVNLYTEPNLVSSYGFLVHGLNEPETNTIIELKNSYGNNIGYFSNFKLNNKLNLQSSNPNEAKNNIQIYDVLRDAYKSKEGENAIAGQFQYLKYSEGIYPKDTNTYMKDVRGRENYDVVYWREERDSRNRGIVNSQGTQFSPSYGPEFSLTQSRWPLDGRRNYTTLSVVTNSQGAEGELQNAYTTYFRRTNETGPNTAFGMARVGALYNRRSLEYDRSDVDCPPYLNDLTQSRYVSGDVEWTALKESGKRPFDETYNDFAAEIRCVGKDYSVVPEFRISDHMEQYIDKEAGNFLAEIPNAFSITGASIADSNADNFFTTYSNSDFLKYFEVIKNDHDGIANVDQITLKCDAIMKLNAYDGFYPVNRTLQLATLFSQSYGDYVIEAGYTSSATSWPRVDTNHTKWRPFLTPFFAPGILYNSIKSGMAVDYPIYTEYPETIEDFQSGVSSSVGTIGSGDEAQWSRVLKTNFSKRIPFEGLVEPENYIAKSRIWDMEPDWSASLRLYPFDGNAENWRSNNQAALWNGRGSEKYKLAMHNFLAEVPNFFLEDGNFTTFVSKEISPEGITITPQQANNYYGMDIFVSNSQCRNLTDWAARCSLPSLTASYSIESSSLERTKGVHTQMYSKDAAFGPPWVYNDSFFLNGTAHYKPKVSVTIYQGSQDIQPYHYSYEPFTPAYFNGFGLIRLLFYPFKGAGKYTLDEIQSNLTSSFIRLPTDRTGSAGLFIIDNLLRLQTLNTLDVNVLDSGFTHYAGNRGAGNGWLYEPIYTHASTIYSASSNWQQLSSSINFLGKTKVKKINYGTDLYGGIQPSSYETVKDANEVWVIQPKWETPILNFYNKTPSRPLEDLYSKLPGVKGMWHQYGDYCAGDEGIWIGIGDLPDSIISSSVDNFAYRSYKGCDDISKYPNVMNQRSENILSLKKENAQVEIIINDVVKIWNCVTCSIRYGGTQHKFYSDDGTNLAANALWHNNFSMGNNNLEFAQNLVKAIRAGAISEVLSASVVPLQNFDDIPVYFTGSDAYYGHTFAPGPDPALSSAFGSPIKPGPPVKILIKVTNGEIGYGYPTLWAPGEIGNQLICSVTSGIPPSADASAAAYSGYCKWTDRCTSSEGWAVRGMDYASNQMIYAATASFYGGITRDYKIKSLADLLGFEKTQKRMGKAAKDKLIKEAVVAIPYIEDNKEKKYFSVSRDQIDLALNANSQKIDDEEHKPGESIIDMVVKMPNYVFPPRMDFLTYRSINPFIMYIFEFEHILSQRDLYDIWQGLQPDIGKSFKKQTSIIHHKIRKGEFFEGNLPENVRWMVFKVKQKAAWNYFAKTADASDDDRFKFDFNIGGKNSNRKSTALYNYNWPYDQFSLVELVKIGAEVEFRKKE